MKHCDVGDHAVEKLWTARGRDKPSACQSCAKKSFKPTTRTKKPAINTPEKKQLDIWFSDQVNLIPERCENCNEKFGFIPPWQRKWVIAHIVPKAYFLSVATHPLNRLFLCLEGCHADYDNRGKDKRMMMQCSKLALQRLSEFMHLLNPLELKRLENYMDVD